MKITKTKLKQIIKEELEAITEDKQAHIDGIKKKIIRLEALIEKIEGELEAADALGADDRFEPDAKEKNSIESKRSQLYDLEGKIELLNTQLGELQQDKPGALTRPS